MVLDVGAGDGRLEPALLAASKAVIATDITRRDLEGMHRVSSLGLVQVGQYPSLPFLSGAIDVVVAIEVPAASEAAWFMAESARVLRPGGSVICSMYNRASYKKLFRKAEDRQYYRLSVQEQRRRWAAAGFRLERAHGFYWLPFTRGSDSSLVPLLSLLEWPLRLGIFGRFSPWTMEHFVKISADDLATD
jgi:SAM-dependent methyltransferase